VLLIAGLFVVGEALLRSGVAYAVGNWLMRVCGKQPRTRNRVKVSGACAHHQIVPHPDRRKVEVPFIHSDCGTHMDMVPNYLIWGLKPYRESLQATE
jgi:hypothetical protein